MKVIRNRADISAHSLRLSRAKQRQRMELVFFIFELLVLSTACGTSIWILFADFPLKLKFSVELLLAYIVRRIILHMTMKR